MPNHFHSIVVPETEGALSSYLQFVEGGYCSYFRFVTRTTGLGHVFQGRFWNKGIENTDHLLTVLRYVEGNPVEAGLVAKAKDWKWSSLVLRNEWPELFDPLPISLPDDWENLVGRPVSQKEMSRICLSARIKHLERSGDTQD
jgi:putative transposase